MKVKWAIVVLGMKHEVNFVQMTFDQYIIGEVERDTRIYLMKRISKLNEKLGFPQIKGVLQRSIKLD